MIWQTIYGRKELVHSLQESVRLGHTTHAYLFYGSEGIGKKTIAGVFATALNCTNTALPGCGNCISCKKALGQNHPDLHWIHPEGKSIKIEQIRKIKKHAYLLPRDGRYQVFIIESADTMTAEAANSLLKVLEEPPVGTVFILLAQQPNLLPLTVRSRCQLFAIAPLDKASMEQFLFAQSGTIDKAAVAEILVWSEGVAGRALFMCDKTARQAQYESAANYLEGLLTLTDASLMAAQLAEYENLPAFLDTVTLVLRDVLILQTVADIKVMMISGDVKIVHQLTGRWHADMCLAALQIMLLLQADLQKAVNTRLILEKALRDLKEVITHADSCRDSI